MKSPSCLCVCLSPYQILDQVVDFYEIWYVCDAIQGDLDAIIFNPIAPAILKWLRFEFVRWALVISGLWLFLREGFPWLHHAPSLGDVTMT
jgi:hypothetical protein